MDREPSDRKPFRRTGSEAAYDPGLPLRDDEGASRAFVIVGDLGSGKTLRPPFPPPEEGSYGEEGRAG